MNYDESVAWLYATQLHGIKLGLANIRRLLDALGVRAGGPAAPKFLHVAGTNGKGSVCAMLDAVCRAAGYRTGLFTSPHLVTFRERICVDGEMIDEGEVARGLTELRGIAESWDHAPTFFELTTALALAYFQARGCEVVVLETGMGGRLDATNAVTPAVCVITEIALDHQQWLGSTLEQIAAEKAGIFKEGVPVISTPQPLKVVPVFERHGREVGALMVTYVEEPWDSCPVNLAGSHQLWNAALAVRALALAGVRVAPDAVASGLGTVEWPGRFQRFDERVALDGAHNPAAAARLAATWREVFGDERATVILGILGDKDLRGICAALMPLAARVIVVPVQNPRSSPPTEVAALWDELAPDTFCVTAPDLATALGAALPQAERVLICGSLFLVGEALAHLGAAPAPEVSAQ